jgi:hypothetical protein
MYSILQEIRQEISQLDSSKGQVLESKLLPHNPCLSHCPPKGGIAQHGFTCDTTFSQADCSLFSAEAGEYRTTTLHWSADSQEHRHQPARRDRNPVQHYKNSDSSLRRWHNSPY